MAGCMSVLMVIVLILVASNTGTKNALVYRDINKLGIDWDFKYSGDHVFSTNALDHVVEQFKVKRYTEWQNPPTTYWGPEENDVTSRLTYRFNFEQPAKQLYLTVNCQSWDFSKTKKNSHYGRGAFAIRISRDGTVWETICDFIESEDDPDATLTYLRKYTSELEQSDSGETPVIYLAFFDDFLSESMLGTNELWVQIQMKATGVETIDTFCPVQHLRIGEYSDEEPNGSRFEVRAKY